MSPQTSIAIILTVLALGGLVSSIPAQENLLGNATFDQVDDRGRPREWLPEDNGTGGEALLGDDGGKVGRRYGILRVDGDYRRAAWRQRLPWNPDIRAVTVTAWYRTREVEPISGKGAAIRFLFDEDPIAGEHRGVQMEFYAPSADWTRVQTTRIVPAGAREVVVELAHWGNTGEVHWDDIGLRPATRDELLQNLLPPDRAVDREPNPGQNLPYSPADDERVSLNPPPFHWLPSGVVADRPVPEQVGGVYLKRQGIGVEVTYRLQVSRAEDFAGPLAADLTGLDYCAQMLTEPLETGAWYWRYGVEFKDPPTEGIPVIWSRSRRFEVAADATLWPYPERDAFDVARARPRLLVRAESIPDLRRRANEGDLRDGAQSLLHGAQKHLGEELMPEPDHLPTAIGDIGPAMGPIIWDTRPAMNIMQGLGFAYALTGDEAAGLEAKRRIIHFFSWDPRGSTGYFTFDDPAMWVMMTGVRAYDWTYDLFTEQERALVEQSMRIRAAEMYRMLRLRPYENNPFESHSGRTLGFLGEAAIAFFHEWEEAPEYLDYVTRIFWGVYPAWGSDDGGWNEGPNYWDAYMSFGLNFVLALREATGIDLARRPFFTNTPYYRLYLTPPHTQMAPFGDGQQFEPSAPGSLMYHFSTINRDPVIRWYADKSGAGPASGALGVLLRDDTIKAQPPTHLPPARLFEGVGLAVLRTDLVNGDDDVGFIMKSSPYGAVSHGHNDQNCFVLEAYGEALAIASGYYNRYGSPHHGRWTQQTKAKNGITFDGQQGQDRGARARGRITAFVHRDDFDLTIGDATEAYGGRLTRALREVVHVRPGVFVIRDDLASQTPRRFEYLLHALDEMTLRPEQREVIIRRPKATLTARFLEPAALQMSQTDQFDPPPLWPPDREYANQWHTTVAYAQPQVEAEFLTVLLPARAGEDDALPRTRHIISDTARGVELTFPDGRRTLVGFALPGVDRDVSLEGLTSNARVFALNWSADGTPGEPLLHGGEALAGIDR